MFREQCEIVENREVAPCHYRLTLCGPSIARGAKPGQFVQVRVSGSYDPLLPRPFSFLRAGGGTFSILYRVVGKGTALLSKAEKGEKLRVLGPLGNGFSFRRLTKRAVLVGGGVGVPPLFHLASEWVRNKKLKARDIRVFIGAKGKDLVLCEKELAALGVRVHIATEDGSRGTKGLVTAPLAEALSATGPEGLCVYACGPVPMLKAVSAVAEKAGVPAQVSFETMMGCGFGACLGCVVEVKCDDKKCGLPQRPAEGQVDTSRYAVSCKEGPVFWSDEVVWR